MKLIKRLILGVILLVILAGVGLWFWGDAAAKAGVEAGGTAALGTKTTVSKVKIGWLSSSVDLHELAIANPEGYQTGSLMALGHGRVACDVGSFLSDEVVIRELILDMPELTIEFKGGLMNLTSNLGDVFSSGEEEEPATEEPEAEGEGTRFRLDLLRISDARVRIHLLGGKTVDATLPTIEMKDVKNSDGSLLLMSDIFLQVLAAMGKSVTTNVKGLPAEVLKVLDGDILASGIKFGEEAIGKTLEVGAKAVTEGADVVKKTLDGTAKGLGKGAGAVGKTLGKGAEAVGDGVKDVGKGVTGALKGILGGKKEEE